MANLTKIKDYKFGLLGLTSQLYRDRVPALMDKLGAFQSQLQEILKEQCDVISYGPASSTNELEHFFKNLEWENAIGLVIVLLSYSPSFLATPFLKNFNKPILIWNTQKLREITEEFGPDELMENHGIHGVQDLASVMLRENIPFTLVTGHYLDVDVQARIKDWLIAVTAVEKLKHSRIGQLGGFFPLMGDFYIHPQELKAKIGVEVVELCPEVVASYAQAIYEEDIEKVIEEDLKKFQPEDLSPETHKLSVKLELALRKYIKEKGLQGLAVNFLAFDKSYPLETVPFLAVSKFLAEGMGYGGEGDVLTASSVLLLQYLTGEANFVEMFTVDFANDAILMNHMAEGNPNMARKDYPIKIKENPLIFNDCKPSAVLSFTLRPGIATLLDFTQTAEGKIKMITSLVEVLDRPKLNKIDSPHFFIKVNSKPADFLNRYSLEGGTHHLAMSYGDQRQLIRLVAKLMDLEFVEV